MAYALGMAAQLADNAVRFGWYSTVNWLLTREAQRLPARPRYAPRLPVPSHDHCRKVMALYDQSKDVRRAKEFCRPLLK